MHLFSLKHTQSHSHRRTSSRDHQDALIKRLSNDPYLDWLMMVTVSSVIAIIFVVIGYTTYIEVKSRLQVQPGPVLRLNSIFNTNSLSKTLDNLNAREVDRNNILQGSVRISDPSL